MKEELENARVKYQAAMSMSSFEGEVQWSRYSAILLVNTIFIAIIGFSYGIEFKGSYRLFRTVAPLLGLLLCFLWYQMTDRGFIWMNHWITEARKIEDKQLKGEINPVNAGQELKSKIGAGVTKKASFLVIGIIAFVYLLMLLLAID
ncbi:MAG: hypothetical protein AAB675_03345 [Patescibacteria group bacterium]